MSLDELIAKNQKRKGRECRAGEALAALSAEDLRSVEEARARGVALSAIARAIREMGYEVGYNAFQRHYRGDCTCGSHPR